MNKIKKLAPHEAQKIAAGEVVERPAHVLKELIENAIDAQSDKISLYIHDGGKTLMRVVDNGCGMSPEDAILCFEQHATSKISCVDELPTINSFGFRGEALASIAAVSKTTLITKENNTECGTKIVIEAQTIHENGTVHANDGTDICIKDLFYNIPARKKFLKTRETEFNQIQQLFFAFCLANIDIDFKLFSQDTIIHSCPKVATLQERITQLFDSKLYQHIAPVNHAAKNINISGYISDYQYERYDRSMIYIFVNKRWIKDATLSHAFIKGYKQVLPPGKYPAGALFIDVKSDEVDINMHPRKEEVQFLHPRYVLQTITQAITQALSHHISTYIKKPVTLAQHSHEQPTKTYPIEPHIASTHTTFAPFNFDSFFTATAPTANIFTKNIQTQETDTPIISEEITITSFTETEASETTLIGQLHKTYLLLEQEKGLCMIDQHAAHERIIYEQLVAQHGNVPTMQFMFPHTINANTQEMEIITEHLELFTMYGIEIELFGNNLVKVTAAPLQLKHANIEELIKECIVIINESIDLDKEQCNQIMQKKLYANMACKAAVKAGDSLTIQEMQEIIKKLQETPNRFSCPHGRPTSWLLHTDEIKKKFKRDYRTNTNSNALIYQDIE